MKPECADWSIWIGPEVEGRSDRGEPTLFVRRGGDEAKKLVSEWNGRVWFCAEWDDWDAVRGVCDSGKTVCLEVQHGSLDTVPEDVRAAVVVYLKIPSLVLKTGDHICVGPAFQDEAFRIGDGVRVSPSDYAGDRRIS